MRKAIGAVSAVFLLGVTACGAKTDAAVEAYKATEPKTIVTQAHTALTQLTSVHVAGTVYFGSEQGTVDLTSDKAGDVTGTLTIVGATATYLVVGGHSYLKAGQDFWSKALPAKAVQRVLGKWVEDLSPLTALLRNLTLPGMIASAKKYPLENAGPTLIGTGNVNGTGTVQIKVSDPATGTTKTLDVAATDPHNVLRLTDSVAADPKYTGSLTFDRFNAPVNVTAPPAADVLTGTAAAAKK
jgi:hypothetical protein